MLFCVQIHGSAGWVSWPAGHWHDASTRHRLWIGPQVLCTHYTALICAECCPADEINAARVWVWRVAGLWYMRRSAVPPLGGWGQTQTWIVSVGIVRQWCACRRGCLAARFDRSAVSRHISTSRPATCKQSEQGPVVDSSRSSGSCDCGRQSAQSQ